MAKEAKQVDYKALNDELQALLVQLQGEDIDVEEAVKLYERGLEIVAQLEEYLKTSENRITKLQSQFSKED